MAYDISFSGEVSGGAAPSALAAGFPPARLAGASFTGNASETATTDLVFFLILTAASSYAGQIVAGVLFDRMRALIGPRE